MSLFRIVQLGMILALIVGCRTPQPSTQAPEPLLAPVNAEVPVVSAAQPAMPVEVIPIGFQEAIPPTAQMLGDPLFSGEAELSLTRLVAEVHARNPTLQAMIAAWQAAAQRYPQVVALDDPMFMTLMAPASFGSSQVGSAYMLEGAQKIPWFGKRAARGRAAAAEANAASLDAEETRTLLVEAAQVAFLDYYLVCRRQDLNRNNIEVMRQFRETAQNKYRANQVTQRDVLQADIELAELDRRQIELDRMDTVAVARINTLLNRPPNVPLPPPPLQLTPSPVSADLELLQQVASQQRPDLAAIAARVRAEEAALTLACKAYYPDGEFFGRYDSFWQETDLRGQVGVRLNVPVYRGRLHAAVCEASFRLSQRRSEYEQKLLGVQYEVQTAYAQLEESRKSLALYEEKLLPVADQNVSASRSNYDASQGSFLDLALAQRQLIEVREKHQEALALYGRRLAELGRVLGGSMPTVGNPEAVPAPLRH